FLEPASPKLLVASYFGGLGNNLSVAADLPVAGHHLDLVRGWDELDKVLKTMPAGRVLSLGVVDGRNIWRTDLWGAFDYIERAIEARGPDALQIAPSCSLLHAPVDLEAETKLDAELKGWMAFAKQKLEEVATLRAAAVNGRHSVDAAFALSDKITT